MYSYLGIEIDLTDIEDLEALENGPNPEPIYSESEVNQMIASHIIANVSISVQDTDDYDTDDYDTAYDEDGYEIVCPDTYQKVLDIVDN